MEIFALNGHTRNITKVLYNRDGDLLFSAGKDKHVVLWRVSNGEPIGTYEGHIGAINDCDVTPDTKYLATGGGDNFMYVWDVETGKKLAEAEFKTSVNSVSWSCGGKYLLGVSLEQRSYPNAVCIYEWKAEKKELALVANVVDVVAKENLPINSAVYGPMDKYIAIASENGAVTIYDLETKKTVKKLLFFIFYYFIFIYFCIYIESY